MKPEVIVRFDECMQQYLIAMKGVGEQRINKKIFMEMAFALELRTIDDIKNNLRKVADYFINRDQYIDFEIIPPTPPSNPA